MTSGLAAIASAEQGLLTPGCPELVDGLVQQRDRLDEAIDELEATRANLDTIIAGASSFQQGGVPSRPQLQPPQTSRMRSR